MSVAEAARLLRLEPGEVLAGSMSGAAVVAARSPRWGEVVLKVGSGEGAATEAAAYRAGVPGPRVLDGCEGDGWTALVLERCAPVTWDDAAWLDAVDLLVRVHRLPLDLPPVRPGARAADPEAFWRTPATRAALAVVREAERDGSLDAARAAVPLGPVHGDAHCDNVLRSPDGRLILADWQEAGTGRGTDDLALLLARAVPTGAEPPESAMVDRYARGRGLPVEDVRRAVRARLLVVLALEFPLYADHLSSVAVERLGAALVRAARDWAR